MSIFISESDKSLVEALAKVTLRISIDGTWTESYANFAYNAACGTEEEFSIGNACAASVTFTVESWQRGIKGSDLTVTWRVAEQEYPLFTGKIEDSYITAPTQVSITAWDAMYFGGSEVFAPTEEMLQTIDAGRAWQLLAQMIGVEPESESVAKLTGISIHGGFSTLPEDISNSAAAGYVAALIGGNALITRGGLLAVRTADIGHTSSLEAYAGEAKMEDSAYHVSGVTFVREDLIQTTDTEGDTVAEETTTQEFTAGNGALRIRNPLANQAAANRAWEAWKALTYYPGQYSCPGGLLVEPGDLIDIPAFDPEGNEFVLCRTLAVSVSMAIDGGVMSTIASGGESITGGVGGSLNRTVASLLSAEAKTNKLLAQTQAALAELEEKLAYMEEHSIARFG